MSKVLLVLLALLPWLLWAAPPNLCCVAGPVYLALNPQAEENTVFLRSFLRRTGDLFPAPPKSRARGHRIVVYPGAERFSFRVLPAEWRLSLPGNAKQWRSDAPLRRRLYGVLLAAQCGFHPPLHPEYLPLWLCAAYDELLFRNTSETIMRANRRFPAAEALLRAGKPLPDFRRLTELDPQQLPPEGKLWYQEFSRLLLEILAADKISCGLLKDLAEGVPSPPWYRTYVEKSGNREFPALMRQKAALRIWNDLLPLPPQLLIVRRKEWEKWEYPELDQQGKPTGRALTATLAELPGLLKKRPDAFLLRRQVVMRIMDFSRGTSREIKKICGSLASLAEQFGVRDEAYPDFCRELKKLDSLLRREEREDLWLRENSAENLSVMRTHALRLTSLPKTRSAFTSGEEKTLEVQEARYRSEF